jgi:thiamine biosynthesis lipoprotein
MSTIAITPKGSRFRAMGTQFEILVSAEVDGAIAEAEGEIRRLERLLSRFDEGSELSRLNREGAYAPGPELLEVVTLALAAREATGGRFDPTVHDAVVAAGYRRAPGDSRPSSARPRCGGDVRIDEVTGRIVLAPGVKLDLGGIAKGWAADRVLAPLAQTGGAIVNAGGDIAVSGGPWPVGVETSGGLTLTLAVEEGGVATSGIDRRRWTYEGRELHHIVDPRTSAPAAGDLLTVTVVAGTAVEAEVMATSLFLAGSVDAAVAEADEAGIPVIIADRNGNVTLAGGLR